MSKSKDIRLEDNSIPNYSENRNGKFVTKFYLDTNQLGREDLVLRLNDKPFKTRNESDLVLKIEQNEETSDKRYQTGNYIGYIKAESLVYIHSRFTTSLLSRMLDVYSGFNLYSTSIQGEFSKSQSTENIIKYIIYKTFVNNLKKASILGFPKNYTRVNHHEAKVKGKIDIKNFIKKDIPFKGKISCISNERNFDADIMDVINKAIKIIEKDERLKKNGEVDKKNRSTYTSIIKDLIPVIKMSASKRPFKADFIKKALNSKSLKNPLFKPFASVVKFAEYIIKYPQMNLSNSSKKELHSILFNVADLWEIYILKLLQSNFPDWYIHSPDLETYENTFFARKIIPDIVMEKDDDILVFDAKYKRMKFLGKNNNGAGDVDRSDFFQIHTYMAYYFGVGKNVIAGGLLYPIEGNENLNKSTYSESAIGIKCKFIIDGIELTNLQDEDMQTLKDRESDFIKRIDSLISKDSNYVPDFKKRDKQIEALIS